MRTMLTMVKVVQFIISDIAQTGYIRFTGFLNFSKLLFVLHILAFTKFLIRWCSPFQLLGTLFKSSFLPLRSLCKSDLQCFQTFEIAVCFGTFRLLGNFYSDDAHHSDYCELRLNHHSFHCSHCVNKIYSIFKSFEIAVCFSTFGFYAISTPVMRTMLTMANNV